MRKDGARKFVEMVVAGVPLNLFDLLPTPRICVSLRDIKCVALRQQNKNTPL
ncbi:MULTISPECIES: hypothetical protein [Okeania]|uniref:hypothetical protein n=1 Tax=Okeania TaxID=1458928 RepID=UPI002580A4BB|nr:hypothetical protein [Okeania sp. SIO2B9]